jgi:hypothetical protein
MMTGGAPIDYRHMDGYHYKNSGRLATFTDNYDQRLWCCISNANLEFHRFEAQKLLMQHPIS